ncbi:KH domain-containing protein [Peptoniphilus sp. KCTC 25270]|uniref:KH domain-containing protein n=1 Tax=Peptoniphilus sp. KCTC 25270 TaxID=2897414 RepID=UPI001E450F5E|nr:KH domain-containing protein [Peptoniphilus sp. KCTC 25270]
MEKLVKYIAQELVSNPEEVEVIAQNSEDGIQIKLLLKKEDMGRVIGRQGRIAKSIRAILKAVALKEGKNIILDIEEKA